MSLRRKEPETRREIDKRIAELAKEAENSDGFALYHEICELEAKRRELARPWEVSRPQSERSLSAWGAV